MDKYQSEFAKLFMPLRGREKQNFLPNDEAFLELFSRADNENKELRIKLGIDPTNTDLHLGHTVCLFLLRRFLQLDLKKTPKPVLIIGDFTATVGDPSGRNEARPPLTLKEARKNAETYLNQVSKILDLNKIEVRYNSEWFSKLDFVELLKLAHIVTVNRLIAKEAFGARIEKGEPLYLHEALYPILQGYDSYVAEADIEIGGIDQTFNILFGRDVQKYYSNQKKYKKEPQLAILNPLLIGLDGKKKMSKSFHNYIALNDPPSEMFGKTMSIPDELIFSYFNLTDTTAKEMFDFEEEYKNGKNPRDIKLELAYRLVKQFYNDDFALKAKEGFIKQFQKNEIPDQVEKYVLSEPLKITDLMYKSGLVPSKTEAKRLIEGGGVKLKSVKVSDPNLLITEKDKDSVLQIGKRKFVKIV